MKSSGLVYIGIDPGRQGALALLSEDSEPLALLRPGKEDIDGVTAPWLCKALIQCQQIADGHRAHCVAALEKTSARPGQGVSSMHEYGRNAGWWEGALAALAIPYLLVAPQRWQKATLDSSGDDPKKRSLLQAARFWPSLQLRAKDDGIADALHIARWCRLNYRVEERSADAVSRSAPGKRRTRP